MKLGDYLEIVLGAHLSSLYTQLRYLASLADDSHIDDDVTRLFNMITTGLKDFGFQIDRVNVATEH